MINKTRSVNIYLYNNLYYIRAYSVVEAGFGYSLENTIHIIKKDNFDELPKEIIETFKECKFGIPTPDYRIKVRDPMLDLTGLKTDKELAKKAKCVGVFLEKDCLELNPWYFDGKSLTSSQDRHIFCSLDPEDIKKTVLEAFERCVPD